MREKTVRMKGKTALEYQNKELVEEGEDLETLKLIDIIAYNQANERRFAALLDSMLEKAPGVPVRHVIAEAAYRLGVSIETAKRYLTKYTAPSAPYVVQGGQVVRKGKEDGR